MYFASGSQQKRTGSQNMVIKYLAKVTSLARFPFTIRIAVVIEADKMIVSDSNFSAYNNSSLLIYKTVYPRIEM